MPLKYKQDEFKLIPKETKIGSKAKTHDSTKFNINIKYIKLGLQVEARLSIQHVTNNTNKITLEIQIKEGMVSSSHWKST